MSMELTPSQLENYNTLAAKIEWRNVHPGLVSKEKEAEILKLLDEGMSVRKIKKKVHTAHQTINRIRKLNGRWGN